MFQSLNSVAQTIGYHIVGKKTYKSASVDTHPPLGERVRFIFFPFTTYTSRAPLGPRPAMAPYTVMTQHSLPSTIHSRVDAPCIRVVPYGSPEGPLIQTLPIARCSYFSLPIAYCSCFSLPNSNTSCFQYATLLTSQFQTLSVLASNFNH